ncbi:hypothetical protein CCUS01_13548, partial [Colletotrichum cuscutae]
ISLPLHDACTASIVFAEISLRLSREQKLPEQLKLVESASKG